MSAERLLPVDIRELAADEVERVDAVLPLSRLDVVQTYLVAWDGDEPVGHAHIAWSGTRLGVPEVQDVFVAADSRRRSISYGIANESARRLYEGLGYRNAGLPPERVAGTILIRGEEMPVDDTLIHLSKDLGVDSGPGRSS